MMKQIAAVVLMMSASVAHGSLWVGQAAVPNPVQASGPAFEVATIKPVEPDADEDQDAPAAAAGASVMPADAAPEDAAETPGKPKTVPH